MLYSNGGSDFSVFYPQSSVTIPNEAERFLIVAEGNGIEEGIAPNLTVENLGITFEWEEVLMGEAFTEILPSDLNGIVKVYNESFAWELTITRA